MTGPEDSPIRPRVRTMQSIALALLMGVITLLGVAVFVVRVQTQGRGMSPKDTPIVSLAALVMLLTDVPLSFVVPSAITRNALRQIAAGTWQPTPQAATAFPTDTAKLLAVRQTAMIVGMALLEGAGFLGGIAYLQEASLLALGVAFVAILFLALNFPTEGRVRFWLDQQLDALSNLRQQGDLAGR
jgi:hypothetical protein